jgi:membrane protein YdbS with pleckstrin-like domain
MIGLNHKLSMIDENTSYLPIEQAYTALNIRIWACVAGIGIVGFCLFFWRILPFLSESLCDGLVLGSLGLVCIGLASTLYHWFADRRIGYRVSEHAVSLKHGLFFRSVISQPVKRIQHVEIKQGPLERQRHLSSLYVYSAGGAVHTLHIPGLTNDTAETLKNWVLAHKDMLTDQ